MVGASTVIEQFNAATRQCYGLGKTLDASNLSELNADAPDGTLGAKFKNAEVCFMKEMEFLEKPSEEILDENIVAKFTFKDEAVNPYFKKNIDECIAWSGEVTSRRRKRDLSGLLPGGMLSSARGRSHQRTRRETKKKTVGKRTNGKKGVIGQYRNIGKKGGKVSKGGEMQKRKKVQGKKKTGNVSGRTVSLSVSEETYKKLWCVDLTIAHFLELCVVNKLS